jgi:hypothetical protein
VAIALENAAESNLIGLKPTVDSTVPRHIVCMHRRTVPIRVSEYRLAHRS